jgi:hypothetical protein
MGNNQEQFHHYSQQEPIDNGRLKQNRDDHIYIMTDTSRKQKDNAQANNLEIRILPLPDPPTLGTSLYGSKTNSATNTSPKDAQTKSVDNAYFDKEN